MTTLWLTLSWLELPKNKCFLWTENDWEMRILGDSRPLRGRQTGGLFNIRVSYKSTFFFLDGALGYGLWLSPSHCWCLAGSWGIFGGLQGMYHYPEHLCCKCFEALRHHFQKSVSSFICSKIGKLGPFGSFVFFVWGNIICSIEMNSNWVILL